MSQYATAPRPINRVLVANRGEIACRVFATCRRLGIGTVAVYSDADADALHVRLADDAVRIGPAPAVDSYLRIDAIVEAARRSGADAVHPGYGFLSENAAFARACAAAGLAFIGPSADVIAAMGSKIEAKKVAEAAGVPTVPGYHGDDQSTGRLAEEARRIGFPVLVKASAGGGGRGMRRVNSPEELEPQLASARREALSAFGDDAMLIEKLVLDPRHLEVQLVGDGQGNLVHLFERECSIQRNNQKVFEEAPAPNLPDTVRDKLYARALKLGRAIGYSSAGTVEFVMKAGSDEPFFLEMNTRLQVEHPVTEAITGIDLVEWQIRVAAGLPLPARQEDIRKRGHAIEARIAAERPELGYQPATGRIARLSVPRGVRFDTGIADGSTVGVHYDSMVAKLIVHGANRAASVGRLDDGLAKLAILGVGTNIAFLRSCVSRPAFVAGTLTTDFLANEFPDGWLPAASEVDDLTAAAAMAWVEAHARDSVDPWRRTSGYRVMGPRRPAQVELVVDRDGVETSVTIFGAGSERVARMDDGTRKPRRGDVIALVEGDDVMVSSGGLALHVKVGLAIERSLAARADTRSDTRLSAPLPGIITAMFAAQGAPVRKGDNLIQMEAMKLVHTLKAPSDGIVGKIHHAIGETVATGAILIDIIPAEGD